MLVKICGITNSEDAIVAEQAGADFIGTIFVHKSKRYVTTEQAGDILRNIKRCIPVALFRNEDIANVCKTVTRLDYRFVQLHGNETIDYVNELVVQVPSCKIIKAFFVKDEKVIDEMLQFYSGMEQKDRICAFLLDSAGGGGTGETFDWHKLSSLLCNYRDELPKIFLAGGLRVENVREAINVIQPDGVDISSGVEISTGKKDANKVKQFISLAKGEYIDG